MAIPKIALTARNWLKVETKPVDNEKMPCVIQERDIVSASTFETITRRKCFAARLEGQVMDSR